MAPRGIERGNAVIYVSGWGKCTWQSASEAEPDNCESASGKKICHNQGSMRNCGMACLVFPRILDEHAEGSAAGLILSRGPSVESSVRTVWMGQSTQVAANIDRISPLQPSR